MPTTAITAPMISPSQAAPVLGSRSNSAEVANVGRRNFVIRSSTPGIWTKPPISASTARIVIGTFIVQLRSAML